MKKHILFTGILFLSIVFPFSACKEKEILDEEASFELSDDGVYKFSFENWKPAKNSENGKNRSWDLPIDKHFNWSSTNYALFYVDSHAKKSDFLVKETEGKKGRGVSIATKRLSYSLLFVDLFNDIVPGVFFIGQSAESGSPGATYAALFGQKVAHEPIAVKGYYAYKAGKHYTANGSKKPMPSEKDKGGIVAVLFEDVPGDEKEPAFLWSDMLYDDTRKVAEGILHFEDTPNFSYQAFNLEMKLIEGKKRPDFENKKYKFAIVATSSIEGAGQAKTAYRKQEKPKGADGSELKIDEIEVFFK